MFRLRNVYVGIFVVSVMLLLVFASSCRLFRHKPGRKKGPVAVMAPQNGVAAISDTIRRDTSAVRLSGPTDPAPVSGAELDLLSRLQPVIESSRPRTWTTFYAKADVHYEGKGDSKNFDIDVRIERDKRIWIRVIGSLLGIKGEGARILITPDSIQALDKMNSAAYLLPWSNSGKIIPAGLDFGTLQTLFTGGAFQTQATSSHVKDEVGNYVVSRTSPSLTHNILFKKTDTVLLRQELVSTTQGGPSFVQDYSDYRPGGNGAFPFTRHILMVDKGQIYNVDIEFGKVEWNTGLEFPFSVPAKYERK